MKHRRTNQFTVYLLVLLLVLICGPYTAYAEVPQQINYQGYLTDDLGQPVDVDVQMVFALYVTAVGGAPLWSEVQTVAVAKGIYNVVLGQDPVGNPFPLDLFEGERYLGVTVGTDDEMVPRRPLTATPFAMKAADSDALEGLASSDFSLSTHGQTGVRSVTAPLG